MKSREGSSGMTGVSVAYGMGHLRFSVPSSKLLGVLDSDKTSSSGILSLLDEALRKPLDGMTLEKAVKLRRKVLIAVPDHTRASHLRSILPHILRKIDSKKHDITIIVACGMHKAPDRTVLTELLGRDVLGRYRVLCHSPASDGVVDKGLTSSGVPIKLNRNLFESDVVISIGIIEPHLYAGYSGGYKTVAIGLAGEETISATHGVRFLDDPLTAIGSIKDNPFHEALREIAMKAPLRFSVNIVNGQSGYPAGIFCGATGPVFKKGIGYARKIYEKRLRDLSDIVICGIGYPKDINLYQASRAVNYVVNVDRPVIRPGGVVIVASRLKDLAGTSASEIRFYESLRKMSSPEDFIASVRKSGYLTGEHRTYMVALALKDYKVAFVSPGNGKLFKGLPFRHFDEMAQALDYAYKITGDGAKIYAIPHALVTIARRAGNLS